MRKLIVVGKVAKPHGFRGDLIVNVSGGTESALGYVSEVFLGTCAENVVSYSLENASWMPKGWKVKLTGFDSDQKVKEHREQLVFVDRSVLKETNSDEYYIADLEGAQVFDEGTQMAIGTFIGVEATSPLLKRDLWWIESADSEFAIPATKYFIAKVDANNRQIWVKNLGELE